MKPLEVPTAEAEGEMECELHSKEFFVQVGILVLEGRKPQKSDKGRIEGKHCLPLKCNGKHMCDERDLECKEAISWKQVMESHWQSAQPIVIDVLVQLTEDIESTILLEQWTISIVSTSITPSSSGSQLLQAIRSHIHFSQLSAWLSSSKGVLPHDISYRTNQNGVPSSYTFIREPTMHAFPLASLPGFSSLQVLVKSLPRCSIQELSEELQYNQICHARGLRDTVKLDGDDRLMSRKVQNSPTLPFSAEGSSPLRKKTCLGKYRNGEESGQREGTSKNSTASDKYRSLFTSCDCVKNGKEADLNDKFLKSESSDDFSASCSSKKSQDGVLTSTFNSCDSVKNGGKIDLEDKFLKSESTGDFSASCSSNRNKDGVLTNLGTISSQLESNGISNLSTRIEKLGRDITSIDRNVPKTEKMSSLGLMFHGKLDERINPALPEGERRRAKDVTKMVSQRKCRSLSERGVRVESLRNGATHKEVSQATGEQRLCTSKQSPTREGTMSNSPDVDIHAIRAPVDRACNFRRSVQLPIGACTEPVFNPSTGLPISSSPAPLRRSTNQLYENTTDFTNALCNRVDYKELYKLLSRSAPASTTQSLLVNFEESVLNGRMEPVGTVEGFTAELSASGSFCPRHIKLPIISCFYRLSDDDAPSPYMGYINLKDAPIGRRGYHVPKRGTVQLTVFNPNMTVVKIFVVLFDCSDMPTRSQTFLRQKTYSALKGIGLKNEVQQTLHYLLHLRFASSKSGKIYLHTDIRVIFARQPPDLGNIYQLSTITDGPTDPKYTKRHHITEEPEY